MNKPFCFFKNKQFYFYLFLFMALLLAVIGVLMVASTTQAIQGNSYMYMQGLWILAGSICLLVLYHVRLDFLLKYARGLLIALWIPLAYLALALLCHKYFHFSFPLVQIRNGACRWISLGGITFQPAEFAKCALILYLASYYGSRDSNSVRKFQEGVLVPLFYCGVTMTLILLERSLSNTMLCGSIVIFIMFMAGVRIKYLLSIVVLGALLAVLSVVCTPYRMQRILNRISTPQTVMEIITTGQKRKIDNFQVERSMCAIGSGGISGRGLASGRMKHKSIPEARTDFIFAVLGEEFGFVGMLLAIGFYISFAVGAFGIGWYAKKLSSELICVAVGVFVLVQALLNLLVVTNMIPTTGVTAPLISSGGSSVLSVILCIGLVICSYRDTLVQDERQVQTQLPPLIRPAG